MRWRRSPAAVVSAIDLGEFDPQAVDRPLFTDFWRRFISCIEMLREKRQRTVFRLTLVNEWNMSEVYLMRSKLIIKPPHL